MFLVKQSSWTGDACIGTFKFSATIYDSKADSSDRTV
jgi:hypothetical protein